MARASGTGLKGGLGRAEERLKNFVSKTIDVQSSTLKDTKGYVDETGVGTPRGPAFFLSALR
jgi:hypothetical protein